MKRTIFVALVAITLALGLASMAPQERVATAREAFLNLPAPACDLLSQQMRSDMLAYLDADTLRPVRNALGGESQLEAPVSDRFLRCRISPVSVITLRVLPGKSPVIASVYTICGEGESADSQITFYNDRMEPVKTSNHIRLATPEDFLNLARHERHLKNELLELIPFPTVEYELSPQNDTLVARLTVADLIGAEDYMKLKPYLIPCLKYVWDGSRFVRVK